jgi:hypothetical protein
MYLISRTDRFGFASSIIATVAEVFGVAALVPFIVAVYWQLPARAFAPLASRGFTPLGN